MTVPSTPHSGADGKPTGTPSLTGDGEPTLQLHRSSCLVPAPSRVRGRWRGQARHEKRSTGRATAEGGLLGDVGSRQRKGRGGKHGVKWWRGLQPLHATRGGPTHESQRGGGNPQEGAGTHRQVDPRYPIEDQGSSHDLCCQWQLSPAFLCSSLCC